MALSGNQLTRIGGASPYHAYAGFVAKEEAVIVIWTVQTPDATSWSDQTADTSLWLDQTPDATLWTDE